MKLKSKNIKYLPEENFFILHKEYENWIIFDVSIAFDSEKFLDYQKDLVQDFVAGLMDNFDVDELNTDFLKNSFELGLQNLNTKLKVFADKVHDVGFFPIKWYIQIIVDNLLVTSMIWDANILIFRDDRLYYSLHNWVGGGKIDVFSDFIEWDIETHDKILYIWTDLSNILDDQDTKELQQVIQSENGEIWEVLEEVLLTRIEESKIWFLIQHSIYYENNSNSKTNFSTNNKTSNKINSISNWSIKKIIIKNKYQITIWIFWIIILFMLYHVLSQVLHTTETDTYTTTSGIKVSVTIEDIKKDIYKFKTMDPTSEEKWVTYNEILDKLEILESKWRRLEDVTQLKKILQTDYHEWFNVVYISDLSQLDDPATNTTTKLLTFNDMEKERMGELHSMVWGNGLMVAGSKWSLLNTMNEDMRWTILEYDEDIRGCNTNLMWNGLYCYTKNWNIFSVTKETWVEPVTTDSLWWFDNVIDVNVYGKSNMYTLSSSFNGSGGNFIKRYRNAVGSQIQFQEWQDYKIWISSWIDFSTWFSSFTIDSTFLAWSNWNLIQFWRDDASSSVLTARSVPLLWWDTISNKYSNNVKIVSTFGSKYVYLFDKENQTFTVYDSRPVKTNDAFIQQYKLYYLFRFTFDLWESKIIDITIPEETWNRPELYILSANWINKVNLYEFIDSILENSALKTVTN